VVELTESFESIFQTKLARLLMTNRFGKSIYVFEELDSTQDYANALPITESVHGTIVIARKQNMGKGRIGRTWISPEGGLWMSIVIRPDFSADNIIFTQFIGALAVTDAIQQTTKIRSRLKWPNDVLINEKKVCGILVDVNLESKDKKIVMGLGLNANIASSLINDYLTADTTRATTIKEEYGNDIDLINLTKSIVDRIEYYYYDFLSTGNTLEIITLWKKNSDMFGRRAIVYDGIEEIKGEVIDIAQDGSLLMKLGDESIRKITYFRNVTFR
jgi:BirA family transcriptional regulator, biotin operon repressor / biotin---[acetyl-CoA-carboxylase] ligase